MIGHFLLTLTPAQEDAVLTERLAQAGGFVRPDGCRCLVGVTHGYYRAGELNGQPWGKCSEIKVDEITNDVGIQFDDLCERFGDARINRAIRNRILANQARRALRDAPQLVECPR